MRAFLPSTPSWIRSELRKRARQLRPTSTATSKRWVHQSNARHLSPSLERDGDGRVVATLNCRILYSSKNASILFSIIAQAKYRSSNEYRSPTGTRRGKMYRQMLGGNVQRTCATEVQMKIMEHFCKRRAFQVAHGSKVHHHQSVSRLDSRAQVEFPTGLSYERLQVKLDADPIPLVQQTVTSDGSEAGQFYHVQCATSLHW